MSDPVSGTTVAAGGLMGASMFGLATGIDYGVVFGAFAGAVFYVATAVNISRLKLVGYFITSFIFGVIGAPLLGSYFSKWTGYSDRPLDALGAVIVAAVAIKLLTFVNSQDLGSLFGILSRLPGGGAKQQFFVISFMLRRVTVADQRLTGRHPAPHSVTNQLFFQM